MCALNKKHAIVLALTIMIAVLLPLLALAETDITEKIELVESRLMFNRSTNQNYLDVSLLNTSEDSISAPIKVVIDGISSTAVTVAGADGTTDDGKPYFLYDTEISGNQLEPGATSGQKQWFFDNATRARFSYTVLILAGSSDTEPPLVTITNPVDQSAISTATPLTTIMYSDAQTGIDMSSLSVQINGVDYTNSFSVSNSVAYCNLSNQLQPGGNTISVTIKDLAGNATTVESNFTVTESTEPLRYLFSLEGSDWVFASPGDGTCIGYMNHDGFGIPVGSDIVGLSLITVDGDFYFSLVGQDGVFQAPLDGTNSILFYNSQLGIGTSDQINSLHIDYLGDVFFSVDNMPDIFQSSGNTSQSTFISNNLIGLSNTDRVNCLHIGYDNTIYFCNPDGHAILQSTGATSNYLFLTAADLGVPGATINAFSFFPETTPPNIVITNPADGAFVNTVTPLVSISFSDADSGIATETFQAELDGTDITSLFSVNSSGVTYQVAQENALSVADHTLKVQIKDQVGNQNEAASDFSVGILRALPSATPTSGPAPLTVYFSTDGEDPAGTLEVFRWDFDGNGSWDTYDGVAQDYTHVYNSPGIYTATLFIQSSTGVTAQESVTITVQNNPPTALADVQPSNGEVPLTVQMIGSGQDVDGSIVLCEWDFDGDGTFDWSSTTSGNTGFTYNTIGIYQAVFRVTDDTGLTSTATAYTTVIEANPPGSPTAAAAATPTEGQAPLVVSFNGTGTDPDNDIVLYEWDFDGDGTFDWSSTTSGNTTHTYTQAGLHVARFKVTDSTGLTGSDQVGITLSLQVSLSVNNDTVGELGDKLNLTALGGISITASSNYESCSTYYPVSYLRDGNTGTYWMSAPGDTPNQGANTYVETVFNTPRTVAQVNISGGSYYSYYGITRARIELFDSSGTSLYSAEHDLYQDAQIQVGLIENVIKFRLTALTTNDGGGAYNQVAIAEIEISDDTGFTATASSTYYDYVVENLFDGDTENTIWVSDLNDHPDYGTNPWVEIDFSSPQTVSRLVVDQSSNYFSYYGTTLCRIELLDDAGTILYSTEENLATYSEVIDIEETENVDMVRFTILAANNNGNLCVLSDLNILQYQNGQYVSLVQSSQNQGSYFASSEWKTNCYSYYPVSNLIDGNTESYWMSAYNETPNNGVQPFVELTFPSPQIVSQAKISGGSWYTYYGITKAKVELFDNSGAVLYSQVHELQATSEIDFNHIENVLQARFTAIESPDPYGYNYCAWSEISLFKEYDEPQITTTDIATVLSADTNVSIYITDSEGNLVRSLISNEHRQQGSYTDNWNLLDDNGFKPNDGIYFAVMEYVENGEAKKIDLSGTTGGERFLVPRDTTGGTYDNPALAKPFEDQFLPVDFSLNQAAEVTFFVGVLNTSDTRIRTILNRVPMPAGQHRVYWDGLDDNENIAEPPPGDQLVLGFWGYSLPDNAIFVTGGKPVVTDLGAEPNYFDPFSEKCDDNGNGEGVTLTYQLSEDVNHVELRVYQLATGNLIRTSIHSGQPAGENALFWDGKDNSGKYTAMGDYQVGIMVTDPSGNQSMFNYTLVRILY